MSELKVRDIGEIGNYYGGLSVSSKNGKFYWGIEDHGGIEEEEIPEYLYIALNSFQDKLEQEQIKK